MNLCVLRIHSYTVLCQLPYENFHLISPLSCVLTSQIKIQRKRKILNVQWKYKKAISLIFFSLILYEAMPRFAVCTLLKGKINVKYSWWCVWNMTWMYVSIKVSSWVRVIEIYATRLSYSFSVMFNWAPNKG